LVNWVPKTAFPRAVFFFSRYDIKVPEIRPSLPLWTRLQTNFKDVPEIYTPDSHFKAKFAFWSNEIFHPESL
jgi:hypothetical protein